MRIRAPWLVVCLFVVLAFSALPSHAQSVTCPSGTYNMLNWMTLDSGTSGSHHLAGNANPLYTRMTPGKFYWTKGANGTPLGHSVV